MKIQLIILICFVLFSCRGEKQKIQCDILGVGLNEVIKADSILINKLSDYSFALINSNDSIKKYGSVFISQYNKTRQNYFEEHGDSLAIRIGSPEQIESRNNTLNWYELDFEKIKILDGDESEAYTSFLKKIKQGRHLNYSKINLRESLEYNGKPIKIYHSNNPETISIQEFSLLDIGFSKNGRTGCFYIGKVGKLRGSGEIVFLRIGEKGWEIERRISIWVS